MFNKRIPFIIVIGAIFAILLKLFLPSVKSDSNLFMLFVFILAAIIWGITGHNTVKRKNKGEPEEDELSLRIVQKAAFYSFFYSIYLWVILLYIDSIFKMTAEALVGIGIIGMSVIFVISWNFFKFKGIK